VPENWHQKLLEQAQAQGIDFLSTPFDLERLALLDQLNVPLIKIASGDLTNEELLKEAAKLKKPIVISTGAAYKKEIEKAVSILKKAGTKQIAILQCVSCYPSAFEDTNLLAMQALESCFQVPVGYSDHTPGSTIPIAAVALGASIIEKHFTDNPKLEGPDHPHSLSPKEFAFMVKSIRELELAMGDGIKIPTDSEKHERVMARRALYAKKEIPAGTILTRDMIKTVRHAFKEGILVEELDSAIGSVTKEVIKEHTLLTWKKLKKKKA
ncbi:MAG TPA: N-acetylneuraminate synthase family protein, partial [Parachlamydiaceae bacterium]|nr:N-acetylneuraminate synthase family protein [Parachlamydiaceae bacterium]